MEKEKTFFTIKLFATVSFVVMVVVNILSEVLPLNGITTGEISDSYPNLFAPTGLTFSIWGLIYVLLALYTLYLLGLFRGKDKSVNADLLCKTGIAFSISSLINAGWMFSWHYKLIPLSMILMVLLLACLIYIFMIISKQNLSKRELVMIRLPFAIYFGWITVATIANATVLLVSLGWNGFGLSQDIWTIIIVAVGAIIGIITLLRFKSIAYEFVFIWAYIGILIKHTSSSGFSNQYPGIITTVIICLVLFVAAIVYTFIRKRLQTVKNNK